MSDRLVGIVEHTLDMVPAGTLRVMTYYGSSTKAKPTDETVANGSVYIETDTQKIYMYDEKTSQWREW